MEAAAQLDSPQGGIALGNVPDGAVGYVLSRLVANRHKHVLFVARDGHRMEAVAEQLRFFAPELTVVQLPAWDCQPYDRASPHPVIVSQRMEGLSRLSRGASGSQTSGPLVVLTTVNAMVQRLPPRAMLSKASLMVAVGDRIDRELLTDFLVHHGYQRVGKVMEPGEFAFRGSIIDLFPPGSEAGVRIDCFDDLVESIKPFDPLTQVSQGDLGQLRLLAAGEILLNEDTVSRFRTGFREMFGAGMNHPLYQAVSEGRRFTGMEHWLPLFYERMDTLFDYLPPDVAVVEDVLAGQAMGDRFALIADYYAARKEFDGAKPGAMRDAGMAAYHPLPVESLYLTADGWEHHLGRYAHYRMTPFMEDGAAVEDQGLKAAPALPADQREKIAEHVREMHVKRRYVAANSDGSRERLRQLLSERGAHVVGLNGWAEAGKVSGKSVGLFTLPLEHGFLSDQFVVFSEQDVLGEKLMRSGRKKKAAERFLAEAATFAIGELVVHDEHGIGRFAGLETIVAGGAPHDCLKILYRDDDRLFVPVENSDVLSRYGSEDDGAQLDKLGGVAWQARKAKLKERIKIAAEVLLKTAAERALARAEPFGIPEGMYDEFCARFPYMETEDQARAIEEVIQDLGQSRPMDRLICGDVGFGKTEVALRAAFLAACTDPTRPRMQVALICPTTLLARQHIKTFTERFKGLPFRVGGLSRLVSAKDAKAVKEGLADGSVDIVIGTHALLAKDIQFKQLGLLIIDEEQNFGVGQKEKLKSLKAGVHVLTLSATPIPRTLQMSLSGIKELSLITTPPVDRLAVRTFVGPYDPVVIREALLREHFRGGKIFYVCPRIEDLDKVAGEVKRLVPEVKIGVAHGQLSGAELDQRMNDFYDGKFDVLISTNIVESGLDIPTANTLVIHKAHMFGLAQLYQLRGRVGRGKTRAYAYLTLPHGVNVSKNGMKRLEVMHNLDTLGAGFTIASHDMDIRGFGNVLGDEQTGHIREVGIELYQQMLEEAVAAAKRQGGDALAAREERFSPQINFGLPVMIAEEYVSDLALRLGLYQRAGALADEGEIDAFAVEMVDRFGPMPEGMANLLEIVRLKILCRAAGVDRVDTGPKGAVIGFFQNKVADPAKLVNMIGRQPKLLKLRADHKLVVMKEWPDASARLKGVKNILEQLKDMA